MLISEIAEAIDNVKVIRHATYDELDVALWQKAIDAGDLTKEDVLDDDAEMGGFTEDGKEVPLSRGLIKSSIMEVGLYGCCDVEARTIHFWRDDSICDSLMSMRFFAHELSHAFLDYPLWVDPLPEGLLVEYRAETVSYITMKAYEWAFGTENA